VVIQRCSSAGLLHEVLHGVNSGLRFARSWRALAIWVLFAPGAFLQCSCGASSNLFGKVGVVDFSGPGDRTDQALNIRSASICEEAFGNLAVAVVA